MLESVFASVAVSNDRALGTDEERQEGMGCVTVIDDEGRPDVVQGTDEDDNDDVAE